MFTSRSVTAVTLPAATSPMDAISLFQRNSIFGFLKARSCMILEARRVSRRWTTCTLRPRRARYSASSSAESPPPTTMMLWSLKKKPSHVAHVDTPRPMSAISDGSPSSLAEAPVATMTVSASHERSPAFTTKGRREKSTAVTSSAIISVPKRSACLRIVSMRLGPITPSTKPG